MQPVLPIWKMFFTKSMEILGGKIDFVLHSIGMSPNVRKSVHTMIWITICFDTTLDISAISFQNVASSEKMDAISEGGSVVALTYGFNVRCLVTTIWLMPKHYWSLLHAVSDTFMVVEKNVRINTISQSPTPTTAGNGVKE